jgi:hypothetical protein
MGRHVAIFWGYPVLTDRADKWMPIHRPHGHPGPGPPESTGGPTDRNPVRRMMRRSGLCRLLDVVDPLIQEVLRDRVGDWHYFWEPALRLRIRWQQATQADYTRLTDFLTPQKSMASSPAGSKEATAVQVRSTRVRLRSSGPISGRTRTRTGRPDVSWPWLL